MSKKAISIFCVAVLLICMFVGCGTNDQNKDAPLDNETVAIENNTELTTLPVEEQNPQSGKITVESLKAHPETPVTEFEYTMSTDHDGILIQSYNGSSDVVVIPSTIDGTDVVDVADYIFANDSTVRAVVFPETVTDLGSVFVNSSCIELVIAEGAQIIQQGCFVNCGSLREVVLGDSISKIETLAFSACPNLESVNIAASLTKLSDDEKNTLFFMCPNLTIYGESGSYIETVASEINIPFVAK